jgi:hypothetical protein
VLRSGLVIGLLLAGRAMPAQSVSGPTAILLGARPLAVTRFCRERARLGKFSVRCPTRYPLTLRSQVTASGSSLLGPSFYWASFNDAAGFDDGDDGHLVFGGQRPSFSLVGSPGQSWPRPGQPQPVAQLGLPRLVTTPTRGGGSFVAERPARILRHATVLGRDALILVASPYPGGGFMGGHVIVLCNWHQHGYMLSFHFTAYTLTERLTAALDVASSFATVEPGRGSSP